MKKKTKQLTKLILVLMSFSFLLSAKTYAYSCSVTCQAVTDDIVDSISTEDSLKVEDFKINCRQFWKGSPSCSTGHVTKCTCTVRTTHNSSGTGYGTDIAEARAAAREDCSKWFNSSAYVTYGSYTCN